MPSFLTPARLAFGIALAAMALVLGLFSPLSPRGDMSPSPGGQVAPLAGTPVPTPLSPLTPTPGPTSGIAAPEGPSGAAGEAYTYTFDREPSSPASKYGMADFDVQVHHRDMHRNDPDSVNFYNAHHGPNCEAPGHDGSVTHPTDTYDQVVFQCANHVMTALADHAYALIYLTPNRLLDWSDGEATMTIDVSTLKPSGRDWWDIWLQEWDGHMALPLSWIYPDLQGRPTTAEWLQITNESSNERVFISKASSDMDYGSSKKYERQSAMERDTFVLTITPTTFSFCKPDESICWMKDKPHGLTMTQAVVSIGHHSYTSEKDGGKPNTWHWDNLSMSDSVPFTIIRTSPRSIQNDGTLCFDSPAPADAYLRFSAQGATYIDGVQAAEVPAERPKSDHFASFMHPIAEGTECVTYSGVKDWSGSGDPTLKDASVFSLEPGAPTP